MRRNEPHTWTATTAAWLWFAALLIAGTVDTHRYSTVTQLDTLGRTIRDARAITNAAGEATSSSTFDAQDLACIFRRTGSAPMPSEHSRTAPAAHARKAALMVLILTAQRARSLIALSR